MLEKCVLSILELNWNQRLGHKKTKINICHHMLTSSIQLQNRSFHVVERTRTSAKCQTMKNARAKRAKILFSNVKYANLFGFCCRRRRRGCLSSLIASLQRVWLGKTGTQKKKKSNLFVSSSQDYPIYSQNPQLLLGLLSRRLVLVVPKSDNKMTWKKKLFSENPKSH